jgi:hypothetical protein
MSTAKLAHRPFMRFLGLSRARRQGVIELRLPFREFLRDGTDCSTAAW